MKQLGLAIHGAMLADTARSKVLEAAVRAAVRPGDVVVDVGAGSALLSMLAVRAGARRVYAVEAGSMAAVARRLVALNGMADQITVAQAMSNDYMPPEPADVLLCETLGFAVLDERFRPTLVDARDRMLRPGGRLVPEQVDILIAPVEADPSAVDLSTLDRIADLDFGPLAEVFRHVYQRRYIPREHQLSPANVALRLDCRSMIADEALSAEVAFTLHRTGTGGGFALWFDAVLAPGVRMSSRPPEPQNHWGQAFLPLPCPMSLQAGDVLRTRLTIDDRQGGFHVAWSADPPVRSPSAAAEASGGAR
jgi:predicted RNA methylase